MQKIRKNAGLIIFYTIIALVFVAPVIRLVLMSFESENGYSLQNYITLISEQRTKQAILNTLIISCLSTLISTVFGSIMAFVVAYTNVKRKNLIELFILMPFIIPSYIITLSWSGLLGKTGTINKFITHLGFKAIDIYSISGIILVLGICNIPIVYMSVVHMLRKIPVEQEWACRACGFGVGTTLYNINLYEVLPAIVSGGLLAFLSSIDNFSVPAFLGISSNIPVLSTYIYEKAIGFGPTAFNLAAALSVMLSVIAISGTLIEGRFLKRKSTMESIKEDYSVRINLKESKRKLIEWIILILLGIINIVPLLSMISSAFLKTYGLKMSLQNFTLDNFIFIFTNRGIITAAKNSIFLAVISSLICLVIGTLIAYIKIRKNSFAMFIAERCASLTYSIPGIVLSLAMIFHWVEPIPNFKPGIYGTIYILVIAYVTRYLVLQIKGSSTAFLSIDPMLEEAVRASGRNSFALWKEVLLPLLIKPILSSTFLIFVPALTELTLSSMLAGAGTKTIGLTIFNFQQSGDYNLSAAMSAVIVLFIFIAYGLMNLKKQVSSTSKEKKNEFISGKCGTEIC